ncbi:MAG: peptidase M28, partial [bacterium]
ALRDQYVVVMAHLDHEGISPDETRPDRIYNGAMDNSAGTSAMLEVARAMATAPTRPRRSIIFLAVTGEEKGLLGSEFFANNPTVPTEGLVAVVNMDMPVLTYAFTDIVVLGSDHSTLGQTYHKPNDDLSQPIDWNAAARFAQVSAGVVRAVADQDQRPLWYAGDEFGDRFAPEAEKAPKP